MDPKPIPWDEIKSIVVEPDSKTIGFKLLRTAYKVKDPKVSLRFYNGILGLSVLNTLDLPSMKMSFYSLGYVEPSEAKEIPDWNNSRARNYWAMTRSSVLEICHIWGTEKQDDFKYTLGDGYGNISFMVPNVHEACSRLESLGVEFIKKPNDGELKGLAFIKDPDGYVIELYDSKAVQDNI